MDAFTRSSAWIGLMATLLLPSNVGAQSAPTLESLWPHQDRLAWDYVLTERVQGDEAPFDGSLYFSGSQEMAPGVSVQCLNSRTVYPLGRSGFAESAPAGLTTLERRLWIARTDLRPSLADRAAGRSGRRVTTWPVLLLGPADCGDGTGFVSADSLGIWRGDLADWSWLWLGDDLRPGASFRLQLVPDLASDVFLDGAVRTQAGSVEVPAGTFDDVLIADYVVDYGWQQVLGTSGEVVGRFRYETRGWVGWVQGVGPVMAEEIFEAVDIECPTCDPQMFQSVSSSAALTRSYVASEMRSMGRVKGRW